MPRFVTVHYRTTTEGGRVDNCKSSSLKVEVARQCRRDRGSQRYYLSYRLLTRRLEDLFGRWFSNTRCILRLLCRIDGNRCLSTGKAYMITIYIWHVNTPCRSMKQAILDFNPPVRIFLSAKVKSPIFLKIMGFFSNWTYSSKSLVVEPLTKRDFWEAV